MTGNDGTPHLPGRPFPCYTAATPIAETPPAPAPEQPDTLASDAEGNGNNPHRRRLLPRPTVGAPHVAPAAQCGRKRKRAASPLLRGVGVLPATRLRCALRKETEMNVHPSTSRKETEMNVPYPRNAEGNGNELPSRDAERFGLDLLTSRNAEGNGNERPAPPPRYPREPFHPHPLLNDRTRRQRVPACDSRAHAVPDPDARHHWPNGKLPVTLRSAPRR